MNSEDNIFRFSGRPVELADLQDALTQQAALIQMSQFGLIGPLLAANAAVRQPVPPIPAAGVIPHPQQVSNRKFVMIIRITYKSARIRLGVCS